MQVAMATKLLQKASETASPIFFSYTSVRQPVKIVAQYHTIAEHAGKELIVLLSGHSFSHQPPPIPLSSPLQSEAPPAFGAIWGHLGPPPLAPWAGTLAQVPGILFPGDPSELTSSSQQQAGSLKVRLQMQCSDCL